MNRSKQSLKLLQEIARFEPKFLLVQVLNSYMVVWP